MTSTTQLTKDQILSADDLTRRVVEVPEWGGAVTVQTLTGRARDEYEVRVLGSKGKDRNLANIRASICQLSIIDPETGKLMFTPAEVTALGQKSAAALDRVFDVASGMSKVSAEDVEVLAGNSEGDQNADSG